MTKAWMQKICLFLVHIWYFPCLPFFFLFFLNLSNKGIVIHRDYYLILCCFSYGILQLVWIRHNMIRDYKNKLWLIFFFNFVKEKNITEFSFWQMKVSQLFNWLNGYFLAIAWSSTIPQEWSIQWNWAKWESSTCKQVTWMLENNPSKIWHPDIRTKI